MSFFDFISQFSNFFWLLFKILKNLQNFLTNHKNYYRIIEQLSFRGVAQLVERAVWDREVGGSRPSTPTSKLRVCNASIWGL